MISPDIGLRNLQIQNYNDIAKTMFITNLPINVQTIIRMRNPNSLEDALNLVLEEEEFQNFAKLHQNRPVLASNNVSNSNNNNAMKPFKSFNQQNQQPFRNFSQQNNFRNYSQPQFDQQYSKPFPSAPINIQSRPVKQNFPTNRQVFGPQKNVWKPNHTSNQPRPTPMSGVSRFSQPRPTPMSGLSYVNNTETADRIPSYDREIYPYIQEFDNERLERITAHEENFEQQQEYYYEDSPESPEEDEELEDSNFQTTRSPQYPTFLIDTGCSFTIIRPAIIEKNFPETIFIDPTFLQTCAGRTKTLYKAQIPAFDEFQSNIPIECVLYDFHNYFDGLIGLHDLMNAQLNINLTDQCLENNLVQIPLLVREDFYSRRYNLNPLEIRRLQFPVAIENGPIIIPEFQSEKFYIPEILTTINNIDELPDLEDANLQEVISELEEATENALNQDIEEHIPTNIIKQNPENDDTATIHTAQENPIQDIPYTEKCINQFANQIIINESNNCLTNYIVHEKNI
ncbi:hypothetical protein NQ317_019015 [Molorchus minor]|uniref:Uncharacterized protein n=1 Tax=Molorchus minor TaxID=1323400 RepID=A0ABQ9J5S9_9CUCU|nr:hypothetical protein NQ317_019015 [Molorchus minor]